MAQHFNLKVLRFLFCMMKPVVTLCSTLLLFVFASVVYAQTEPKLEFTHHYGYQQENLHWSIAGNSSGQSPNVYSELKWMHNSGFAWGGDLKWNVWQRISVFASFNRLNISSGKIDDTDYAGDNRTNPTYQAHFNSNKGSSTMFNAGAGYQVVKTKLLTLTPALGYVLNRQSLYILDNSGQFTDLNSNYFTDWKGAFAKLNARLSVLPNLQLEGNVMYSQVNYNAHADWNLIETFQHPVSYRHHADGYGFDTELRFYYHLAKYITLHAGGSYFNWQTGKGTDQLYLTNGTIDKTQMNGVFRNGFQVSAGLSHAF